MKILFILPTNMISGGNFVAYVQAHALFKQGHQVSVAFQQMQNGAAVKTFPQFELPVASLSEVIQSQESFDVAISTFWDTWYNLADINSHHFLAFVQSDERKFYENRVAPERSLVEQTYRDSRIGIITEARWIEKMLTGEMAHPRVAYAPNGIDLKVFQAQGDLMWPKAARPRVLIEGPGGTPFKRVGFSFEVAEALGSEIEIVYVSTDGVVEKSWRKLAKEILVQIPQSEMPNVYRSCDILLKLSSVEGFFGPPLEMMACGGACLVSRVSGFDEYIVDGENALVVDVDNKADAIEKLRRLVRSPDLRKKLSESGLATAGSMSWESRTPLFAHAIMELIKTSKGFSGSDRLELKIMKAQKTAILSLQRHEDQIAALAYIRKFFSPIEKLLRFFLR